MPEQEILLEMPAADRPAEARAEVSPGARKLKSVDRSQFKMVTLDVDSLVPADHKARAIWELTGKLDLSGFWAEIRSEVGGAGREHNDPRWLVSIWLYAYREGISAAREVSRQMEHEPGLRWLAGLEVVNHTTRSEFRTAHREALEERFTEWLAVREGAGLEDLEQVMHDGTKIQAQASASSFRREKTVRERLEQARGVVEELGDPDDEGQPSRREAARRRVARQQAEVLERAMQELEQIRQSQRSAEQQAAARVSLTEPEARPRRHGKDGGIAPSYHVQITTDAKQKVIVGVSANPKPAQVVVDGGFMGHQNVSKMAEVGVELIGPLPDTAERQAAARKAAGIAEEFAGERFQKAPEGQALICPQGQRREVVRQNRKRGNL